MAMRVPLGLALVAVLVVVHAIDVHRDPPDAPHSAQTSQQPALQPGSPLPDGDLGPIATVYGNDDRRSPTGADLGSSSGSATANVGDFTRLHTAAAVILFHRNNRIALDQTNRDQPHWRINTTRLTQTRLDRGNPRSAVQPICSDVPLFNRSVLGFCSGTLVAPDLVLTAGHCIDESECASTWVLFDFAFPPGTSEIVENPIAFERAIACQRVVSRQTLAGGHDWAVFQLSRDVPNTRPWLRIDRSNTIQAAGTVLNCISFPMGQPMVIDSHCAIKGRDGRFYTHSADTLGGSSGCMLVNSAHEEVLAVESAGPVDWRVRAGSNPACLEELTCPENTGCPGGSSTSDRWDTAQIAADAARGILEPIVRFPVLDPANIDASRQSIGQAVLWLSAADYLLDIDPNTNDIPNLTGAALATEIGNIRVRGNLPRAGGIEPMFLGQLVALHVLRRGGTDNNQPDKQWAIRAAQLLLRGIGGQTVEDQPGVFGQSTETAVRNFQQAHNLKLDGIIGRQTWRYLFGGTGGNIPDGFFGASSSGGGGGVSSGGGNTALAQNSAPAPSQQSQTPSSQCPNGKCNEAQGAAAVVFLEFSMTVRDAFGLLSEDERAHHECCKRMKQQKQSVQEHRRLTPHWSLADNFVEDAYGIADA